jgi:hypothetical protein
MVDTGYAPRLHKAATLDHLRKKKPIERSVVVVLEDEPLEVLKEARKRHAELAGAPADKPASDKALKEAEKAVKDAETAVEDVTVEVRFRAIGRVAYDELVAAHPPTEQQKKDSGEDTVYNPETFCPALVAASAIEPKMTYEEVVELFKDWNGAELSDLFFTALACNTQRRISDVGKGFGQTGS